VGEKSQAVGEKFQAVGENSQAVGKKSHGFGFARDIIPAMCDCSGIFFNTST
jgi:hypothetical protein